MSDFLSSFSADDYAGEGFGVIPNGDYEAILVDIEEKKTKAGTGVYFKATLQLVGGEYDGRMVWENFNVVNPNSDAERIGRAQFADLCRAVNVIKPKQLTDLCDIPLVIKLKADKNDPDRNVVKAYKPRGGGSTMAAVKRVATKIEDEDVPQPEPAKKAPWKR